MGRFSDINYLKLSKPKKFFYKLLSFFIAIPMFFVNLAVKIGKGCVKLWHLIVKVCKNIYNTFVKGSWKTKVSYFIMGFGNLSRGQILRGLLFFIFQVVFILYMIFYGAHWLSKLDNLGDSELINIYDPVLDTFKDVPGDNSFKILLYAILTISFIIAFIVTWYINVDQNRIIEEILAKGKKLKSGKSDLRSLVDDQFHKTLLALPLTGIFLFTVVPIIFMILVAFTNYDSSHDGYKNLFTWVGFDNFNELTVWTKGNSNLGFAFGEILSWTIIWAFFATFSNYFLGMFVAMMINRKGIKLKKLWRGVLVLTIAVPQFISLLYVSKAFNVNGLVNGKLFDLGLIEFGGQIPFWTNPNLARVMVILINIWIGIPYLMLITTGVLMNIPQDLYESAKIDGANAWRQYTKITFPYMMFITGPYLLTSFIGNLNNFNVIYLLTGAVPANPDLLTSGGSASDTDLLITWLFKITLESGTSNYKLASVIGVLVFLVVATISLIVYNILPSNKNEEDYA